MPAKRRHALKIPKGQIELTCAPENFSRYRLDCVMYDITNQRVIASDGHRLVRCSVMVEEGDVSCLIPAYVFEFARNLGASHISTKDDCIQVVNGAKAIASFPRETGDFPNVELMDSVLDSVKEPLLVFNLQVLLDTVRAMKRVDPHDDDDGAFQHVGIFIQQDHDGTKSFVLAPVADIGGCDTNCIGLMMPIMRKDMEFIIKKMPTRGAKVKAEASNL
jgi:hypothetical protein